MSDAEIKARLVEAARMHVPFDGWSETSFKAAVADSGIDSGAARVACPRGAVDLALAFHAQGDAEMVRRLEQSDLTQMRFRDRVAAAVRFRLEAAEDKELVRRGMTLFALPQYAGDGAKALWQTCDLIWTALGDSSDDINWYTKRATLSAVYGSTVLFWLGDHSDGDADTWAFLDRRIGDVMQIETMKAKARGNPLFAGLMKGPLSVLGQIRAPQRGGVSGMPGRWSRPNGSNGPHGL